MQIEEALARHLAADGRVAGIVGTRIYPGTIPQDQTLEAIAYQRVPDEGPIMSHQGPLGVEKARLQVTCQAQKYSEALTLAQAVKTALQGFRGPMAPGGVNVYYCRVTADLDGGLGQEIQMTTRRVEVEVLASVVN